MDDVNTDLTQRVVVHTVAHAWQPSPSGTVWRKPLYRQGGEYGPVTSVVRYAAGGAFAPHTHPQGEEILVLEGVFADEHGDYPAGTYLLNPDGSRHAPRSPVGCVLLVRLRQYAGADRPQQALATPTLPWEPVSAGVQCQRLYAQAGYPETMTLLHLDPGAHWRWDRHPAGEELFVLTGDVQDADSTYPAGTWIREPASGSSELSSTGGCRLYRRSGRLA